MDEFHGIIIVWGIVAITIVCLIIWGVLTGLQILMGC